MKKTDDLITLLNGKSDNEKIKILNKEIDRELTLDDGAIDCGYIDECADLIIKTKNIPFVPYSETLIREKTSNFFDLYETERIKRRRRKISGGFKTALKVLAAAIALIFLMGCALYIVNRDAFYLLLKEMGYDTVDDLPQGNTSYGDKTVKRALNEYSGRTKEEIKEKTGVDICCPSYLPDGYFLEMIYYTVFEDEKKIGFKISPSGDINISASDRYKASDMLLAEMERYDTNGMTFYLSEIEALDENGASYTEYRALFNDGDFQYTVTSHKKDVLQSIIEGIVK